MELCTISTVEQLRKKIRDHDLVLIKADKGNMVVLVKRVDYDQKVSDFLSNNKCNVGSVDSDFNFHEHITKVRSFVGVSTLLRILTPSLSLILFPLACMGSSNYIKTVIPIRTVVPYVSAPQTFACSNIS